MKKVLLTIVLGLFAVGCEDFDLSLGPKIHDEVGYYYECPDNTNNTIYVDEYDCNLDCTVECTETDF